MKIAQNTVVSLAYELEVEGKIADKAGADKPLEYIHGNHMLLPRFEEAVEGKEPGDSFEFTLSAEDGYGEYKPEYRFDIPKESFMLNGELQEQFLQVGGIVPLSDANGNIMRALVAAVGEDSVTVDFNHPMAGKVLHFTGSVVAVREAKPEELENGCCHGKGNCHCKDDGEGECHCHENGEGECHCKDEEGKGECCCNK